MRAAATLPGTIRRSSPTTPSTRRKGRVSLFLLLGILLLPLSLMILKIPFSQSEAWTHVRETVLSRYVLHTLTVSVSVTLFATLIGVSGAWFVTRYSFPMKRALEWMFIFPKAIPAYIAAYSYKGIFDYTGFGGFLGVRITGVWGLVFVLSLTLYPYVYLVARAAFSLQSASLIEASRSFPGKRKRLFLNVALPLAKSAILAGAILVFMESLNEYGAALYLGVDTLTTGIFRAWFLYYDLPLARILSFMLLIIACAAMLFVHRQHPRFQLSSLQRPGQKFQPRGATSAFIFFVLLAPIALGFVLPAIQLLYWTLLELPGLVAVLPLLGKSFVLAGAATLLCIVVSMLLTLHPRIFHRRKASHCAFALSIGYAVPGAVIAIGVLGVLSLVAGGSGALARILLSTTVLALMYGYLIRYITVSFTPFHSVFASRCRGFHEISCTLGKKPLNTLFSVHLPLMRRTIITTALLVFIDILKDLPLTIMLRPFNFDTLSVRVHELVEAERIVEAAPPALLLIVTGLLPILFLFRVERRIPCRST